MNEQIRNLESVTIPDLEKQLGCKSNEALSNYLFIVGTGGNDFSLNYFLKFPFNNSTLPGFISKLITGLSQQLQKLYDLGGRKFVVMSLYPNGCSPMVRARLPISTPHDCVQTINVPLGIDNVRDPCGEVLTIKEGGNSTLCKNGGQACSNRNKFVWFDGLHPTEAVNVVLANKAFNSELNSEVYPTNVKKLIEG
uniref:Zinc finger protein n=2 Tax=Solanum tuberosum TaxID=4113 RepID=M1D8B4_SOLTU